MAERSQNPDKPNKDVGEIEIEVAQSSSLEKIEEEIRAKLKSHRVEELMRTEGKEICLCITSVGPHG